MKKGFLHRWLENRAARERTIRSLAYNIELCRNSARRAIEKAQAGKANYSMLKAARTANRDAMEASYTLWMISGGKLTKKELALYERRTITSDCAQNQNLQKVRDEGY